MRIDSPISCNAIITGSFTGSFKGDGSQLTGVTAEWDGSHTGNASIDGDLTVSNLITAGNVDGVDVSLLKTDFDVDSAKLAGIEAGATGDQSAAEIKSAYESNADTNEFSDAEKSKLAGIEASATGDQTGAEIKALYEAEANAFTDAQFTKLAGIEAGATGDQTAAEIKSAYESNADTNAFDDAAVSKLAGIEAGATGDQTAAEIRAAVEAATDSNVFTDADHTKLDGIEAGATNDTAELSTLSGRVTDVEGDVSAILAASSADKDSFAEIVTLINSVDTENDTAFGAHAANTSNPHSVTKAQVGLGSVDNTSDADKPISTATQTALNAKQAAGTYNTIIGTDTDLDTSGAEVVDQINVTDGVIQSMSKRTMTLADLGYTGATNANNYAHPSYTIRAINTAGAEVIDVLSSDSAGHVTNATKRTMTLADLGYTGAGDANNYYIGLDNTSNVHFEGLMIGQTSGATANTIRCVGDVVAYYSSDLQFKDNVQTLEGALDKVKAIRGVRFDWNDKQDVHEGHDIGVIAQEVEAVLPELVHHREHNDSKAVDYVKLTAVLIEAVKELSAKVDELSK